MSPKHKMEISGAEPPRQLEFQYKNLIENAPVGLYRTTSDGRILYANPYLVTMMGYDSLEQLQQRNLEDSGFHEGGERAEFKKQLNLEGQLDRRESIWIKRDGSKFYVVESARIVQKLPDGMQIYEGFAIDVTERKLAELETLKSERKYRELFHGVTDGIIRLDKQGRIIEANKAFLNMLGYSGDELLQLSNEDITPEKWHSLEAEIFSEQVALRGYSDTYEKEYRASRGNIVPVEMVAYAVYDSEYNMDGSWATARNISRRKQYLSELEKSKSKLLNAQEIANIGNWEWDMVTGKVEMSSVCRTIFGIEETEELTVEDIARFIHPDDKEKFIKKNKLAHQGTVVTAFEHRIIRDDNTIRYLKSNQKVSAYDSGKPTRVAGTVQDITEIKYYQLALEESQGKLLEAQHIANLGNWTWNMISGDVEMSSISRRIFGIDQDARLTIDDIWECIHPDDIEDFQLRVKKARDGDFTGFYECRIGGPGRLEKYLQFRHIVSAYENGNPSQLTGTIQDVSEIKYYQMELEENQKQLETALKQEKIISEIAFKLNRVGSFKTEINQLLGDMTRIIGVDQICFLRVNPENQTLKLIYCSKSLAHGQGCGCSLVKYLSSVEGFSSCFTQKQILIYNDLNSCPEEIRNGLMSNNISSFAAVPISISEEANGLLVFSHGDAHKWSKDDERFLKTLADVISSAWGRDTHYHARLEAERKNRESARLLAQSSRLASLGVLAGSIAHEINQPLNAIRLTADSFAALASKGVFQLPEKYLNRLQKISEHVCRVDGIIQKMRYLWSPFSNTDKELYELNSALERATASVLEQFSPVELHIEFNLAPEPVLLFGNPLDIEQIVVNLLANSRDALKQCPADERRITIGSRLADDKVILTFEDNGPGFQTDDGFKLFDPFYSTKLNQTGMGFGLAIVRKIVENNGGKIDASNCVPHGALIKIILPLEK